MPNRSVLSAMLAGLDRAHHHLARVHTDADLDRRAPLLAQLACVALDVLLHLERRQQCPLRMILVRDRRPEQREDPVAGGLHHIALVAMRRFAHQLERGIDQAARLLRVEVFDQLHRALDIGEQRGDGLTLALRYVGRIPLCRRYMDLGSGGLCRRRFG